MSNKRLSAAQMNLKLALWNAEAESTTNTEVYSQLQAFGLPREVLNRLHELLNLTRKVAGKVFPVGKIILLKIIEFVKAHPFLVVGAGIGGTVGAAVAGLITSIPFLGPLLAPIAAVLGITITATGAVIGHKLDKQFQNIGEDIFEIVQEFFYLVIDIFNSIFRDDSFATI